MADKENIEMLQDEIEKLKGEITGIKKGMKGNEKMDGKSTCSLQGFGNGYAWIMLVVVTVLLTLGVQQLAHVTFMSHQLGKQSAVIDLTESQQMSALTNTEDFQLSQRYDYRYDLSGGEHSIQDCSGPFLKQSFHDIDYALLGYNVLRGYPMAIGHDPGFTLPIFLTDYSQNRYTSDCRFNVPRGFIVIPDVSCVTSFSSSTIKDEYEFSKSLSTSAKISGGGWGASFSASAGYKQAASDFGSVEVLYIVSEAKCHYFYSQIDPNFPPPLHPSFVKELNKLLETNANNREKAYMDFFDRYGTHFSSMVTFGARYTQKHRMSIMSYKNAQQSSFSVEAQASYSGIFSIGGGFSLDSDQRQAASNFSKNSETTTVTVGAPPPANGDATTWASTVKDNPVPSAYVLESIENLFTAEYMSGTDIDYKAIQGNITNFKGKYCHSLLNASEVESCDMTSSLIHLSQTQITAYNEFVRQISDISFPDCLNICHETEDCYIVDYSQDNCTVYGSMLYGFQRNASHSVALFPPKIAMAESDLHFWACVDPDINPSHFTSYGTVSDCKAKCFNDTSCLIYSTIGLDKDINNRDENYVGCSLYSAKSIKSYTSPLVPTENCVTYFLSRSATQNNEL